MDPRPKNEPLESASAISHRKHLGPTVGLQMDVGSPSRATEVGLCHHTGESRRALVSWHDYYFMSMKDTTP